VKKSKQVVTGQNGKNWVYRVLFAMITATFFYTGYAYASFSGPSIGQIATQIITSFSGLAKLVTAGSYIAGMGFALSSILKFKQHKDNPTQIPIGTPIALLFIAAALIFLPTIFGSANQTIFAGSGSVGGISGIDS
jgi:intracellular multiplication protein IcmD